MSGTLDRRRFLRSGLAGALTLGLPGPLLAQADAPAAGPEPAATLADEIAPGVRLIRGAVNGLALATAEGPVLVDAPASRFEGAAALYGSAQALFNSNWRPEHTAANDALGRAGVPIMAHENTKLWMSNDFTVAWEHRHYDPRPDYALPNATFYTSGSLEAGDETIEYGHLAQAHTDGDIYVFFRRANVLAVSDLLAVGDYPVVDYATGGWIGGLKSATERLLALADKETLIVPAVGAPQKRDALEGQLELCATALTAVGKAYTQAHSLEELVAARPLEAFEAERGDPGLFLELAYKGVWGHIRELGLSIV